MCKWGHTGAARGPRQLGTPLRDRITVHVPNFGRYLRTLTRAAAARHYGPRQSEPAPGTPRPRPATPESRTSTTKMRNAGPKRSRTIERRAARTPRSRVGNTREQTHAAPEPSAGAAHERTGEDAVDGDASTPPAATWPDGREPAAPSRRSRSEYTLSVAPTETRNGRSEQAQHRPPAAVRRDVRPLVQRHRRRHPAETAACRFVR